MRLRNYTEFTEQMLREIIAFVRPNGLFTANFDVKVTNSRNLYCGKFYERGGIARCKSALGTNDRPLIIARITKNENKYPYFSEYKPTRVVKLFYDKYNEVKERWKEGWCCSRRIAKCIIIKRKLSCSPGYGHWYNWRIIKPKNGNTGGYIDHLILSREEALVDTLAHEFKHFCQANHQGKRGKVWGARGVYSDRDAGAYAIKKLRAWRAVHNPKDVIQICKLNWRLLEQAT